MVFSSLVFICIFLPIVFGLYCIIPSLKAKNGLLIGASLLFYSFGEPVYVLLMLFSSLFNYGCARAIGSREDGSKSRVAALVVAVVVNLGLLAVFKYMGMLVGTADALLPVSIPVPDILLPIGISFYTFQALSYVIDVYWNRVDAQSNYGKVLLYISFFPQLIAGPIVKYHDISVMLDNRRQTSGRVAEGVRRFICGLAKKVLIANNMAVVADAVFGAGLDQVNFAVAWIGALAYTMQIYYDFSGYSDMAIGLGKMFGFQFKENFQYPYASRSIKEFWRRWHISLSTWFKEYVYIPLGGNRKGTARTQLNKVIVFFLTGLWHGASWTFVVWGLYHGLFMLIEGFVPAIKKLPRAVGHVYALLVVVIGWVLFRAETLPQAGCFIAQMFTGFAPNQAAMSFAWQQLTPLAIVVFAVAVIGCAPIRPVVDRVRAVLGVRSQDELLEEAVLQAASERQGSRPAGKREDVAVPAPSNCSSKGVRMQQDNPAAMALRVAIAIVSIIVLAWCLLRLSGGTYNPFIYFRF